MDKGLYARIALAGVLTLTAFLNISCIYIGNCGETARCEKEVPLSAPLQAGSSFSANTADGFITIKGLDTTECRVLAKVVAHARTQEAAEDLAEKIHVRLEPAGDGLKVVIDKPAVIANAHFGVSFTADVPAKTSLALETSDGAVSVTGITGRVDAKTSDRPVNAEGIDGDLRLRTSDGSITIKDVRGDSVKLRTSDGSIHCRNIVASQMECHTSDGGIEIELAPEATKAINLNATTSDGSISLTAPPGLSAAIDAETSDGSIRTHLPIMVQGKIGGSLHGIIGAGEGKIYLKTSDGSITIR